MVGFLEVASGIGGLLGGIGGLFGKGKTSDPRSNIHSAAKGAREAAEKYGFNPLTLLQNGAGGFGGTSQGSAPPLASIDLITGGLRDVNDVVSGDAARRRQADELKLDLARLELEKLRSGVVALGPLNDRRPPSAVASMEGDGGVSFGRRTTPAAAVQSPQVVSNPDRTSVQILGHNMDPYMGMSDAEEYEKRYGELGGAAMGLGTLVADGVKNIPTVAIDTYRQYQDYIGKPFVNALGGPEVFDGYFSDQQDALTEAYKNEQERKQRSAERMKQKGVF